MNTRKLDNVLDTQIVCWRIHKVISTPRTTAMGFSHTKETRRWNTYSVEHTGHTTFRNRRRFKRYRFRDISWSCRLASNSFNVIAISSYIFLDFYSIKFKSAAKRNLKTNKLTDYLFFLPKNSQRKSHSTSYTSNSLRLSERTKCHRVELSMSFTHTLAHQTLRWIYDNFASPFSFILFLVIIIFISRGISLQLHLWFVCILNKIHSVSIIDCICV